MIDILKYLISFSVFLVMFIIVFYPEKVGRVVAKGVEYVG